MPARRTLDQFVALARQVHPHANYDYDHVVYVDSKTQIVIGCPRHKSFVKTPNDHLMGYGCPHCGRKRMKDKAAARAQGLAGFIAKVRKRLPHANLTFEKFRYVDIDTKGIVTCPLPGHGDFEITPRMLVKETNCPACSKASKRAKRVTPVEVFIAKAKARHPDAGYGYDNVVYVNAHTKVTITCPKPGHGDFQQAPAYHAGKSGQGCPKCHRDRVAEASRSSTEEFIAEARKRHARAGYTYQRFVYTNYYTPGIITCPKPGHGDFSKRPQAHLRGVGCPKCVLRVSVIGSAWLDDMGVRVRELPIRVPGRSHPLYADGYDPQTNTVYEFLGDYFHGNPKLYDPGDFVSSKLRMTYGMRYARLTRKLSELRALGYSVVTMWESDFRAANPGRRFRRG